MNSTICIPIFQIDAFADAPFKGNPAAVCPLEKWLPDAAAACNVVWKGSGFSFLGAPSLILKGP